MTFEVEVRGPLTKGQYNRLIKNLEEKGKFVSEKSRLSVMYFRDDIPEKSDNIKDDPVDLRVRITNKKAEIVMKYGSWGGSDNRKEFIFPIDPDKFEEALEFLKYLGWHIAVVYATKSRVYTYKGIEFAVVNIKDFGYNYEAEILVNDDSKTKETYNKIRKICQEFDLREYNENEFEQQCNEINNTKELQFDFNIQKLSEIRKNFNEFF